MEVLKDFFVYGMVCVCRGGECVMILNCIEWCFIWGMCFWFMGGVYFGM